MDFRFRYFIGIILFLPILFLAGCGIGEKPGETPGRLPNILWLVAEDLSRTGEEKDGAYNKKQMFHYADFLLLNVFISLFELIEEDNDPFQSMLLTVFDLKYNIHLSFGGSPQVGYGL